MRNMMFLLVLAAGTAAAQTTDPSQRYPYYGPDLSILQASDLVPWCRQEAEARYIGRGEKVYQWSASHSSRGQALKVEGRLRVEGRDVKVECRIASGARLRYATVEIEDPKG